MERSYLSVLLEFQFVLPHNTYKAHTKSTDGAVSFQPIFFSQ